ncbi:MAG: tRNA (adenosine(37)-N6)-threonylcarbamoyltransferase complex ATPase subunit type 1 TsaE [Candidatus Magasanikbacteria bacterium]|nr:tRNA (adenosine(37)-N6)-threonylcarbamoyltransferase complex ATPase subunit type 1 TsaE [Candidatus Magasanikbacteria bacterium]
MKKITNSFKETAAFGKELTAKLTGGTIVLLSGDLGAGKTALTKGIAKGFGIKNEITSPTFTLMNVYQINKKTSQIKTLVHIDTYRLKDEKELIEIGAEDYLGKDNTVCIIEWPEKISKLLQNTNVKKNKIISISIEHQPNSNQRKISLA